MNPNLALIASVQAGNGKVDGVHGPITGTVTASGSLAGGASKVRVEMGSAKITLAKGSSVRIKARTTLGKVSVDGDKQNWDYKPEREVVVGGGAGTLDIDCTMGTVKVTVE